MSSRFSAMTRVFRHAWPSLLLTGLLYRGLALVLLVPLSLLLFHCVLAWSGRAFLADQDILLLATGPLGWLCLVVVGACWLSISALEVASLLAILASDSSKPVRPVAAIWFAVLHAHAVLRVTARIVGLTLLTAAPCLALAAVVYCTLLGSHDINFYLKEKPPSFLAAVGIGILLTLVLVAVLLRLFTGWFFALPLVLFEDVRSAAALRVSRQRASGRRRTVLTWLLAWGVATTMVSLLVSFTLIGLGRLIVPRLAGSLTLLTMAIGVSLLVWAVFQLVLRLLSAATFATVLCELYQRSGGAGRNNMRSSELRAVPPRFAGWQLTTGRLMMCLFLTILVAFGFGAWTVANIPLEDDVAIIAHRGASRAAPENTLAAIRQAIADGADSVEVDVQETADGEVVVFHDSDFMKLAGLDLKIWNATQLDLRDIDIGSWFDASFKDERVPLLRDVLDACQGNVRVVIELKYYGHDQQLEERVVDLIESRGGVDDVVFMSLKLDAVKKMKALRPDWTVGLLMSVSAGNLPGIEADFVAVNATFATPSFVRAARRSGQRGLRLDGE